MATKTYGSRLRPAVALEPRERTVWLPPGVLQWKTRFRAQEIGRLYMRFADRTEEWFLGVDDDGILYPAICKGVNRRG